MINMDFGEYLRSGKGDSWEDLDLSNSSILECIEEYEHRQTKSITKELGSIKKALKKVQEDFGMTLWPHQVTDIFWSNLCNYLNNNLGLKMSSIKVLVFYLRATLSWASRYGASPGNNYYELPRFTKICSHKDNIILSPDDILEIHYFDLFKIPRRPQYIRHLQRVKDTFVLCCNLGLKYNDQKLLNSECFKNGILRISDKIINLDSLSISKKITLELLQKYNYTAPCTTDKDCFERYLKELLGYLGSDWTEEIKIESMGINGIKADWIPKNKLITSMTARNSFIAYNIMKGTRLIDIKRAVGFKLDSSIRKYENS